MSVRVDHPGHHIRIRLLRLSGQDYSAATAGNPHACYMEPLCTRPPNLDRSIAEYSQASGLTDSKRSFALGLGPDRLPQDNLENVVVHNHLDSVDDPELESGRWNRTDSEDRVFDHGYGIEDQDIGHHALLQTAHRCKLQVRVICILTLPFLKKPSTSSRSISSDRFPAKGCESVFSKILYVQQESLQFGRKSNPLPLQQAPVQLQLHLKLFHPQLFPY